MLEVQSSRERYKETCEDNKGKKRAVTAVEEEADTTSSDYSQKPPPKRTTSTHYTKFINELLDILDDMGDMKGSYLVMDNCSIHGSKLLQNKILRRGYKFVYLPTYSQELNAIEQFWSLVKGKMKRDKLLQSETMSSRIRDACEQVFLSNLYGFANHSKCQISKCYDRIPF